MKTVIPRICALVAGSILLAGCGPAGGKVKGTAPLGKPRTILAAQAGDTPRELVFEGKIIEKCPVAGCWFRLDDDSSVIKVDTKTAGFVVTDLPLQTRVTVGGKLVHEGEETILEATGIRY